MGFPSLRGGQPWEHLLSCRALLMTHASLAYVAFHLTCTAFIQPFESLSVTFVLPPKWGARECLSVFSRAVSAVHRAPVGTRMQTGGTVWRRRQIAAISARRL